jgi:hypothetical protein
MTAVAENEGLVSHELGDACLVLRGALGPRVRYTAA